MFAHFQVDLYVGMIEEKPHARNSTNDTLQLYVQNGSGRVHIGFTTSSEAVHEFVQAIVLSQQVVTWLREITIKLKLDRNSFE